MKTGCCHLASRVQPVVDPVNPAPGADSFVERSGPYIALGGRPCQTAGSMCAAFGATGLDQRFADPRSARLRSDVEISEDPDATGGPCTPRPEQACEAHRASVAIASEELDAPMLGSAMSARNSASSSLSLGSTPLNSQ